MEFVTEVWSSLSEIFLDIGPYIILGLLLAGLLRAVISDRAVARLLGRDSLWEPVAASLIGVPLPLCSCSVLPFAFGLRRQGAGRGAVTAFLTSTPQTGVDSILVSYSFFGLPFALFKVAVAFVSGTVSGWLAGRIGRRDGDGGGAADQAGTASAPPKPRAVVTGETGLSAEVCGCGNERCDGETERAEKVGEGNRVHRSPVSRVRSILLYAYDELLGDFALTLLIGIIISAGVTSLVPEDLLGKYDIRWIYYPAVLLLSVPLYICATSSVPLAFSLVAVGLPPGAAMVLLIAGPATNIATIGTVAKILGKRNAAVYTFIIVIFALLGGILFDSILGTTGAQADAAEPLEFPYSIQLVSAIILAALLAYHTVRKIRGRIQGRKEN